MKRIQVGDLVVNSFDGAHGIVVEFFDHTSWACKVYYPVEGIFYNEKIEDLIVFSEKEKSLKKMHSTP